MLRQNCAISKGLSLKQLGSTLFPPWSTAAFKSLDGAESNGIISFHCFQPHLMAECEIAIVGEERNLCVIKNGSLEIFLGLRTLAMVQFQCANVGTTVLELFILNTFSLISRYLGFHFKSNT